MDDLYDEGEINKSLSAEATAFEELLAGLSLSDDIKPSSSTTSVQTVILPEESATEEDDVRKDAIKPDDTAATKPPQPARISPGSQIFQTLCSATDALTLWLGKSKAQLSAFIEEAKLDPEHPMSKMCKNIQSIVVLLEAKGDEVLDPTQTTFGYVEVSLSKLLEYLADVEGYEDGEWLGEKAIRPALRIGKCLTKQKGTYMMVDGKKKVESVAEDDRVVIESSSSESEDDSEDEEVGKRPRVILVPKSRRGRVSAAWR